MSTHDDGRAETMHNDKQYLTLWCLDAGLEAMPLDGEGKHATHL